MTENPLADAVSKFLTTGGVEAPVFKVIASPYCEAGNMLLMDPAGTGIVDVATELANPGLKLIVTPNDEARQQVLQWARELDLDLLDDE